MRWISYTLAFLRGGASCELAAGKKYPITGLTKYTGMAKKPVRIRVFEGPYYKFTTPDIEYFLPAASTTNSMVASEAYK